MGNIKEVLVPDLGGTTDVGVIEILVTPGARVAENDPLVTLESDKASMDIPAPFAGVVQEIKLKKGDAVNEGMVVALIEQSDGAAAAPAPPPPAPPPPPAAAPVPEAPPSAPPAPAAPAPPAVAAPGLSRPTFDEEGVARAYAGPAVRRFARELGVDLALVTGTGRKGRIVKEDVQGFVKGALAGEGPKVGGATGAGIPPIPAVDFARFGAIETKPLSRIRRASATHLHRAWLNVPHVTQHEDADITELEAFRKHVGEEAKAGGVKLTFLPFLMKACAATLEAFPEFNSSLAPDGQSLVIKRYFHLGIAVDTPDGLVVPVVRNVDQKGLLELAAELAELSARAREGKLKVEDLAGGTFSISSLGGIGGTAFTPIVNAPEVAILGVSRASLRPVWTDGAFVPRLLLPLSLSYDHRVIDGAAAARFITHLARLLADLRRLLL